MTAATVQKAKGGAAYEARNVPPSRVATDPPTRPDGLCIVDGKERPRVAVLHDDPFCSTDCCRAWYCCPRPESAGPGRPVRP